MSEFVALAEASRVSPGTMQPFDLSGREIVIANVGGDYFAFSNKCTCIAHFAGHVEGSSDDGHSHVGDYGHLIEGELKDGTVVPDSHHRLRRQDRRSTQGRPGEIPISTWPPGGCRGGTAGRARDRQCVGLPSASPCRSIAHDARRIAGRGLQSP